jgi:hypothetical protein
MMKFYISYLPNESPKTAWRPFVTCQGLTPLLSRSMGFAAPRTFEGQAITPGGEFNNENTTTGHWILKSPLSKSASISPLSFS